MITENELVSAIDQAMLDELQGRPIPMLSQHDFGNVVDRVMIAFYDRKGLNTRQLATMVAERLCIVKP